MRPRLRFGPSLAAILGVGFLLRLLYVFGQSKVDLTFSRPILDGEYFMAWARAVATGLTGPGLGHPSEMTSAFYLAPLYPLALGLFLKLFGENYGLLYYVQQIAALGAAAFLALAGRRVAGDAAGLAAGVLLLLYHPMLFFASRPVGEALALLFLTLSLWLALEQRGAAATGIAAGIGALARPNLLLLPAVWLVEAVWRRRWARAGLLLAGTLLALSPALVRNLAISGHPVAISANAGLTLYHGNAPEAKGVGWFAPALAGRVGEQQRRATRLASFLEERALDPVEADRFWRREALGARLADPVGTLGLVMRRVALTLSNHELGLNYAPALDPRPWRWIAPLPFALLLGLAGAGVALAGWRGTGGWTFWAALSACAVAPIAFYVSSRYRLPAAALLCLPAAVGLAGMLARDTAASRRRIAFGVCALLILVSWLAPVGDIVRRSEAGALSNRAVGWLRMGNLSAAERDVRRSLELQPDNVVALRVLDRLFRDAGREAETREFVTRAREAHPMDPRSRWTHAVWDHIARDDLGGAWRAVKDAEVAGAAVDPELSAKVERAMEARRDERRGEGAGS